MPGSLRHRARERYGSTDRYRERAAALMAELRARQTPRLVLYSGIDPEDLRRVLRQYRLEIMLDAVVAKPDAARMVAAVRGRG
jgi:hypothetical protein